MQLEGPYSDSNVFARILRKEIPCVPVYEDEQVLAFMDAFPQAEGHVLVIAKTSRARNILDVEPEALQRIIVVVQGVARAVRQTLRPDGLFVGQFNGGAAGQTVDHLHFHVVPRWNGQAAKPHGQGGPADIETLRALAARIAAAYGRDEA